MRALRVIVTESLTLILAFATDLKVHDPVAYVDHRYVVSASIL